jgi:hypothetical protein
MTPEERRRKDRERYANDPAYRQWRIERSRQHRAELREAMKSDPALLERIRRQDRERSRRYYARKRSRP